MTRYRLAYSKAVDKPLLSRRQLGRWGGRVSGASRREKTWDRDCEIAMSYHMGHATQQELADDYGLDQSTICRIIRRTLKPLLGLWANLRRWTIVQQIRKGFQRLTQIMREPSLVVTTTRSRAPRVWFNSNYRYPDLDKHDYMPRFQSIVCQPIRCNECGADWQDHWMCLYCGYIEPPLFCHTWKDAKKSGKMDVLKESLG